MLDIENKYMGCLEGYPLLAQYPLLMANVFFVCMRVSKCRNEEALLLFKNIIPYVEDKLFTEYK